MIRAVIWDVDGTLSDTEEIHRTAFNDAFPRAGLNWHWDAPTYRRLFRITGGKERIAAYATEIGLPVDVPRVAEIHRYKTATYVSMINAGEADLRPGVRDLIDVLRGRAVRQAIATTTSRPNVDALIGAAFGRPADTIFDVIASGDEVRAKKPAPDVFLLALERLNLRPDDCLAVEDSEPGLAAAKAAGLRVIVTPSAYTDDGDFRAADWVRPDLAHDLPPAVAALILGS